MTDRELLELAAKAARLTLMPMEIKNVSHQGDDRFTGFMTDIEQWPRGWFSPLTDDGDALRLATKLMLSISLGPVKISCTSIKLALAGVFIKEDTIYQDSNVATRLAIVRAAAEIGKAMS